MKSRFVILHADKTFCPHCHESVDLLSRESGIGAAFYICWGCKRVSVVGVGEVKRDKT